MAGYSTLFRLQQSFLLVLLAFVCTNIRISQAYTYEPPGRDPVSIDKVRNSEQAVRLTTDNFDEATRGKLVFIKFYSPYCPHCKSIADDWNKLETYYAELPNNDNNVLIGSIDCTDSPNGKELCAKFKIMGLPTLMYGDPYLSGAYLKEYGGDKTFEDLKAFAEEALVPTCNPGNLDACSASDRQHMENFIAMTYNELDNLIKKTEKMEDEVKSKYKNKFAELQKNYDDQLTEKEMKVTKIKANMKLINEIIATKE